MKKLSKYLNYSIVAIALMYGLFYLQSKNSFFSPEKEISADNRSKVDVDQVVNKFMRQTAEQSVHDQLAAEQALKKQLGKPLPVKKVEADIKYEDIPLERQIWKEDRSATPAEVIQSEVFDREMQKKIDENDRKEYARQYIENARQAGYHLVLSPDLKVLSVTPIRKPSQDEDSVDSFPAD